MPSPCGDFSENDLRGDSGRERGVVDLGRELRDPRYGRFDEPFGTRGAVEWIGAGNEDAADMTEAGTEGAVTG